MMEYFTNNKNDLDKIEGVWLSSYKGGKSSISYIIKISDGHYNEYRDKDWEVVRSYKKIGNIYIKEADSTDNPCTLEFKSEKSFLLEWTRLPGTQYEVKFSGLFKKIFPE